MSAETRRPTVYLIRKKTMELAIADQAGERHATGWATAAATNL